MRADWISANSKCGRGHFRPPLPPVVKQILRELLVADHQRQISMRRRDKADIDMNIPASTP